MKKTLYIFVLSISLLSCAVSKGENYYSYDVIVDGKTYSNVHLVNAEEGLVVFTHNMKSYYFTENFEVIKKAE